MVVQWMRTHPSASIGDTGSVLGPGRFYMLGATKAHAPQLLSPHSTA